ncbi:TonB-dependent receptor [Roseateles asaccharophilus]|uniref:TonB-dependent receptor n=1 Tax=Roseateles asaccharophilus TaxID=582607 RepID=A0ABU2AB29_9BURK|nr:TonB-dependent receptor [Roseateles asaccharophilus]MDR7334220.1 TonB-dependent receptor [Roseateles asaccharophilus]
MHYKKLPLVLSLGVALGAHAQTQQLDTIVVTGQRASLQSALDKQRAAQGVLSVVHADGIGQLPDDNAAEALARLPGVTLERDQGEGRFVRVRGLGSDYNTISINGATVPASEAGRRAPGLDVVPAGLIRSLEVHKTLTPDMDASSLGGSVGVNTLTAFDVKGRLLSVDLGANHDSNLGATRPRLGLTFADRFADGKLGVALAVSRDERRFASDNVETGGAWDEGKLEELELRRYTILRSRTGAAFSLDWRPADGQQLYLRGFASRFNDDEQRQSLAVEFEDAQAAGELGEGTAVRGLKARKETARTASLALGGSLDMAGWQLTAETGLGRAQERTPMGLAGSALEADFDQLGFTDSRRPLLQGPAALRQAAGYELDEVEIEDSSARDRVRHLKLDLKRGIELAGGASLEFKAGAKATRRHKDNQQDSYALDSDVLGGVGLTDIAGGGPVSYPWGGTLGPAADAAKLRALWRGVKLADHRDDEDSLVGSFDIKEDVDAAYAQATWERGGFQLLGGLRMERISFKARGAALVDGDAAPVSVDTRSTHWMPALLLRQELGGQLLLRAALTNSLVRPSFEQLSPGRVVDGDEAELGNPQLKPLRSRNLDFGVEQGLGRDGTLSAYVFTKRIRDFVFQTDLAGSPGWQGFDQVTTFANGASAKLHGVELAYAQALRSLPAPCNGLIVGANASFVRSKARVGGYDDGEWKSREISLPSQSDRSFNLSLGWEGRGVSARLALHRQSSYLLEVGDVFDPAKDLRVDGQKRLDLSLKYAVSKQLDVSFEAANLTNQAYYVYQATPAQNAQYERYGRSFKLGLKWSLF